MTLRMQCEGQTVLHCKYILCNPNKKSTAQKRGTFNGEIIQKLTGQCDLSDFCLLVGLGNCLVNRNQWTAGCSTCHETYCRALAVSRRKGHTADIDNML